VSAPSIKKLMKRYKNRCAYCGRHVQRHNASLPSFATRDHIKPRADGGLWSRDNMALACKSCNIQKADLSESAFRALLTTD